MEGRNVNQKRRIPRIVVSVIDTEYVLISMSETTFVWITSCPLRIEFFESVAGLNHGSACHIPELYLTIALELNVVNTFPVKHCGNWYIRLGRYLLITGEEFSVCVVDARISIFLHKIVLRLVEKLCASSRLFWCQFLRFLLTRL